MSLRRSARVQASISGPKVMTENTLKRAFATTKSGSVVKSTKGLKKPIVISALHIEDNTQTQTTDAAPTKKPIVQQKRRKIQSDTSPLISAKPSINSPREDTSQQLSSVNATRPVEPHVTNAPLVSPTDGHVVTAYEPETRTTNTAAIPPPTATTSNVLEEAVAHLIAVDTTHRLAAVISVYPCPVFTPAALNEPWDPFSSLSSGIISQQVSGAAAKSIKNKFISLFPESTPNFPPPSVVAVTSIPTLRSAGLSHRKAEYIQGLAEKFVSGELDTDMLARASDDEVMERLVAVRGLGRWSVEMFSFFDMKRMDVFSTGDLGIQRGMAAYMGKDVIKLKAKGGGKWKYMSEKDMLDISAKFSPYRSLFMWYMWKFSDVDVDALQKES